ncbi:MAG: DUF4446 family protein, partial [Anaerolineales bacterium]
NNAGFYLWALTTALVIVALAWLAYNTFAAQGDTAALAPAAPDPAIMSGLDERVTSLAEAAPHMQATLGRSLQYTGLVRFTDVTGAQAFSLAVSNARGDGFVLSSSVRGGITAKPLTRWSSLQPLSLEEQSAIDQARGEQDKS